MLTKISKLERRESQISSFEGISAQGCVYRELQHSEFEYERVAPSAKTRCKNYYLSMK